MNRGLAISGGVLVALAILVPLVMVNAGDVSWEDMFFLMIIVVPLASLVGLVGLVLLITGLASGNRGQQQQQQIVVVTGGAHCHGCGQLKGDGKFCPFCGVPA